MLVNIDVIQLLMWVPAANFVSQTTQETWNVDIFSVLSFINLLPSLSSPGVEPVGNVVMKKAVFTVETISAGMGEVLVYVEDPAGHREEVHTLTHTHTFYNMISVQICGGFVMLLCFCVPETCCVLFPPG